MFNWQKKLHTAIRHRLIISILGSIRDCLLYSSEAKSHAEAQSTRGQTLRIVANLFRCPLSVFRFPCWGLTELGYGAGQRREYGITPIMILTDSMKLAFDAGIFLIKLLRNITRRSPLKTTQS